MNEVRFEADPAATAYDRLARHMLGIQVAVIEAARQEHDDTHSYGEWSTIAIEVCERPVCAALRPILNDESEQYIVDAEAEAAARDTAEKP